MNSYEVPINFSLAMALIEEHKARTKHDVWKLDRWNFCEVCLWLMNVKKELDKQENETSSQTPTN